MNRMPRLIDDKFRTRVIWIVSVLVLIVVVFVWSWLKFSAFNEQRRSVGQDVASELETQIVWMDEQMGFWRQVANIEDEIPNIDQYLQGEVGIDQSDIDFTRNSRQKDCQAETERLANECQSLLKELPKVREKLDDLSSKGSSLLQKMLESASSQSIQELKNTRAEAEKYASRLHEYCDQHFVFSSNYSQDLAEGKRIIEFINDNKDEGFGWSQGESLLADFAIWKQSVTSSMANYDQLDSALTEVYHDLRSIPMDSDIRRKTIANLTQRLKELEPLIAEGEGLRKNSVAEIDNQLLQQQAQVKYGWNTVEQWRQQHGENYVSDDELSLFKSKLNDFEAFRKDSLKKLKEMCNEVDSSVKKAEVAKDRAKEALVTLESLGSNVPDETVMRKCQDGDDIYNKLPAPTQDLRVTINRLKKYRDSILSTAPGKVTDIGPKLEIIQSNFPSWANEGQAIARELAKIKQSSGMLKFELEAINNSLVKYRNSYNFDKIGGLKNTYNDIKAQLSRIEGLPTDGCSNGKELTALKQKHKEAERLQEELSQKIKNLASDRDNALRSGEIYVLEYVPYTASFAASLQNGMRHFELALDLPVSGSHHVEIRFQKRNNSLFRVSPTHHKVIASCKVSLNNVYGTLKNLERGIEKASLHNFPAIRWDDSPKDRKWSFDITSNFPSGYNNLVLDLNFAAIDGKGNNLDYGARDERWQFMAKGNKENFTLEVLVDGKVTSLWAPEKH